MAFRKVLAASELWVGEMRRVHVEGVRVLLLRVESGVFAYEDRCAHLGVALTEGTLEGCTLTCKAHHYEYDVTTGSGTNPRGTRLRSFPVRADAEQILVDVSGGMGP